LDDYHTIVIWDWKKGEKLASQRFEDVFLILNYLVEFARGHNDKIFCLRWNPYDEDRFVTVGVKHIKFWTRAGGGMTSKQGVFGKAGGKQGKENQMCVVFGKTVDVCITGGGDGCIYIWTQTVLTRKVDDGHTGPLFAITAVQDKVRLNYLSSQEGFLLICRVMQLVGKMEKLYFGIRS
jgi:WD40 repeat protein